ncbi:MAG: autotransporter domain-containing protein [Deltaproteobacteria bacterium]|nr:autotransporter domain-containing protein [Deltaproteobacteria bacterium]
MNQKLARLEKAHRALREQVSELDQLAGQSPPEQSRRLRVYGFFDVNFRYIRFSDEGLGRLLSHDDPMFVFGNLNIYFDARPSPNWRFMTEIRFLLNPVGDTMTMENPLTGESYEGVDTLTADALYPFDEFNFGAIEIERAHVTWQRLDWLRITMGLYLTPFGVWNVDHGSPTRATALTPIIYATSAAAFFPERQLGIKVHGQVQLDDVDLDYEVTLSNGAGTAATLVDPDKDKALGGRIRLGGRWPCLWKLGLSGYAGRKSAFKQRIALAPTFALVRELTVASSTYSLGLDLAATWGPWVFQAEVAAGWVDFEAGHRPEAIRGPGTYTADRFQWGAYGFLGYELPFSWIALRPYFSFNWVSPDDNLPKDFAYAATGGLALRPAHSVVMKVEYTFSAVESEADIAALAFRDSKLKDESHNLYIQIAVAF